jgi:U3 small nucleolar RNA-associated protein 13
MAVASNSEQFHLYDLQSSSCSMVYGHSDIVLCMDWQATLGVLATGSKDSTARLWTLDPEAPFMNQYLTLVRVKCVGCSALPRALAIPSRLAASPCPKRAHRLWSPPARTRRSKCGTWPH